MNQKDTRAQVRRVLLITLLLNILVALGKIILGISTGALAILADGFHSVTDGAGNVAGLIANTLASKPPDDDHPYGHRRFESLAALLIGAMLLLTAWEIVKSAIERLQSPSLPDTSALTLLVLGLTLIVNIFVSRYQIRQGKRLRSEILLADARNTYADVFVTLSVIASTIIVSLTGFTWVDTVAALVVVVLIVHAAWQIVQQTGRVLVDTAPYPASELREIILALPSVEEVVRVRSRGPVDAAFVDVDLRVAPAMTADQSSNIAVAVKECIFRHFDGVIDVQVRFQPNLELAPDPALTARASADALGLRTHEVPLSYDNTETLLEMHVEVAPQQTLGEAHEAVSQLELDLARKLPFVDRVVTHIEPTAQPPKLIIEKAPGELAQLEAQAATLLSEAYPEVDWHDITALWSNQGLALALHAMLPAQVTIDTAHQIAEMAETHLRAHIPDLIRVTIHTEPFDH